MLKTLGIVAVCLGLVLGVPLNQVPDGSGVDDDFPEEAGFFEGDIELEPGENPYDRNAVKDHRLLWPGGQVPYEIDSYFHGSDRTTVMNAMNTIMEKTKVNGKNCITFTPRKSERAYIKYITGTGCHTPVGKHSSMSGVTLGRGCMRIGTVMHETLHALGFWHEQSRPDRDSYVIVHWDNIQSGHSHNFNKMTTSQVDTLGEKYDYESVMHYGAYSFAIDRRKPTIEPLQRGVVIGQRTHLSPIDIEKIQLLYGCINSPSHTQDPNHTLPPATNPPATQDQLCTFQTDMCGWTNVAGVDSANWIRHRGPTPSQNTGPSTDHSGSASGYYLYIEASGQTLRTAILQSPLLTPSEYCIGLYYHMYGHEEGSLRIYLLQGHLRRLVHTFSGDQGNVWKHFQLHITGTASTPFQIQLEGHIGSNYHSDIAIDDISIHQGACNQAIVG